MVILHPETSVVDAARAMVDNHVGCVLVTTDGRLVGIVTDRDLACEVVAAGLDVETTRLSDVMTEEPTSVAATAKVEEIARVMRDHACRRVPLVEDGRPAGLVTLDDLVVEGAIDAHTAAEIVRAQLELASRHKRSGVVHPEAPPRSDASTRGARATTRRSARAETSWHRLLRAVARRTGLPEGPRAALALEIVVASICRRTQPEGARKFVAQLPSVLQDKLRSAAGGPDRHVTRDSLEKELAHALSMEPAKASRTAEGIADAVAESMSAGQIDAIRGQLPEDMKALFSAPPTRED